MNLRVMGLRVAGTILGLIAFEQLWRLMTRTELVVAGHNVSRWVSGLLIVIAGGLSLCLWELSRSTTDEW